jgi:hypothetical protein
MTQEDINDLLHKTQTPTQQLLSEAVAALEDMLAGWQYIRQFHGDLYGVGWERCEANAIEAIRKAKGGDQ